MHRYTTVALTPVVAGWLGKDVGDVDDDDVAEGGKEMLDGDTKQ